MRTLHRRRRRPSAAAVLILGVLYGSGSFDGNDSAQPTRVTPSSTSAPDDVETAPTLVGRMVFTRAGGVFGDETVFIADLDGSNERQLTPLGHGCCPWTSRDGAVVVVAGNTDDGRVTSVVIDLEGGDQHLIVPSSTMNLGPGPLNPDGTRIAFEGFDGDDSSLDGIYIGDATDGSNLVRMTTQHDIPGDFSLNGQQLVFFRSAPGTEAPAPGSLFVVDIDGTGLMQLTPDDMAVQCCFNYRVSPDGASVLFADDAGSLHTVGLDGRNLIQVFHDTAERFAITPTWSPDGSMILFALDPTADPFAHPVNGLFVIAADGTGLTPVLQTDDFKREPSWIPV